MITITYEKIMMLLALFTALCVAGGWLLKIIRSLKKPSADISEKLDRDNKRLNRLEEDMDYISKSISLLMKSNLAILGHMANGNNTSDMAKMEKEIQEFLIKN